MVGFPMTYKHRFAIRTIRNGRIKLDGKEWEPEAQFMLYDGRLDDQRFAFGRYFEGVITNTPQMPILELWGTEEFYYNDRVDWPGPECVDGSFPWGFWHPVE